MDDIYEHNRRAWDARVNRKDWYIDTAGDNDFRDPLRVIDPCGWLNGDVRQKRILCLAAGGGRHSVLFAAAGACVTVVDISARMLELDRTVAARRQLTIRTVQTSMDDLSMLAAGTFDIVVQPVSTCYVPSLTAVYREVSRVIAANGVYVSQHKQPVNMQAETVFSGKGYVISEPYYRTGPLPGALAGSWHREAGTQEFLHRWDDLIGGLCRSGFVIEDVAEPRHGTANAEPGSFAHRSYFVPPYIKLKARRISQSMTAESRLIALH